MTHTPTPWKVYKGWIVDRNNEHITDAEGRTMRKDDSKYIVTACNAHEALLASLKEMTYYNPDFEMRERARKAIALAEVKA